jgi:hypothetical protein
MRCVGVLARDGSLIGTVSNILNGMMLKILNG